MKIKIEYKYENDCFFAFTNSLDKYRVEVSVESFDVAKRKLLEEIKAAIKRKPPIIPEPEEVEVEV